MFQHRPAVLVVAESASDIAEAVRFARAGRCRVAVQATGHGVARVAGAKYAFVGFFDATVALLRGELATMTALVEQAAARPPFLNIWKVAHAACLVASGRGHEARPVLDATRRCVWPSRSVWWSAAWLPRSAAHRSHVNCVSHVS